ncbi:DUF4232 domain-containing protein [Streptomyces sp. NPDC051815]|uniref:DUF4232 domain-containing protein n=1 Tax=Streptomyces sp. NPDC051815 TaxID=3365674 RepID=UPI0037B7F210
MARTMARTVTANGRPARCRTLLVAAALLAGAGLPALPLTAANPAAAASAPDRPAAAAPAPPCRADRLTAGGAERQGTTGFRITVVNEGPGPCVLTGHPALALAGQGAPGRGKPLAVTPLGAARPVQLAAGAAAQTRISFTPVLGEADGYCASGAEPFAAPSMVVGVAGARIQLGPDDGGNFALCGTGVRATAFRPAS